MNQTAKIISIYAADTSGFCSALYEYGGMSVIHDASGCNSTYTTHDEPRWYDMDSMMYISGLTESDAVMGNDEKFISDLCLAAKELHPEFVAICASALPAMVGIDMEAIAYEVEDRTGIPAFEVKTNAMQSYITGAANAFVKLTKRFASDESATSAGKSSAISVNILGLTPLDFPLHSSTQKIRDWLTDEGLSLNSFVGMDTSLEDIKRLPQGDVSLVVSSTGKPLAEYLYQKYKVPYVIGTPYGQGFADYLADSIRKAAGNKENINAVLMCRQERNAISNNSSHTDETRITIIGESILSTSLAAALSLDKASQTPYVIRVIESVGDGDMSVLAPELKDISCSEESLLEEEIKNADIIIADPLFQPICHGKHFVRLPHRAFSGRTFDREEKQLIGISLNELLKHTS